MEIEKRSRRKARAIETRDKIRKSADQLFKEYGIDNVSVDSIVEMARVSKGAFYVHFDSKDSLAAELISEFVNKMDLDYKSYLISSSAGTSASDILTSLIGKIADTITCNIGYGHIKTLYKIQITKAINTETVISYNRDLYKMFSAIISKGIQQGEFRTALPVDILARHCIMAYRGLIYEWCMRYPDFNLKEQALKHFEIMLTGIKKQ